VIAAVVVLAGGLAVYLMRNGGDDTKTKNGSNEQNPIVAIDAGPDQIAMADAVAEDITPDTSTGVAPVGDDVIKQLRFQCKQAIDAKRWPDLITCAESLKVHDQATGEKYYKQAHDEERYEAQMRKLAEALKTKDYKAAKAAFDAIGEDSVYRKDAKGQWDKLEDQGTAEVAAMLRSARRPDCKAYNDNLRKAKDDFPPTIISKAIKEVGCTPKAENPPPEKCDYDELFGKGQEAFSTNSWQAALQAYEAAYRCKPDSQALKLTVAAACRAKNIGKARTYWNKMTQGMRDQVLSICVGAGVTADQLKP
jgi:hypothetical protein